MSMLTPQGMGGQYRIKGNKYPRMRGRRRRGRLAVVAVASALALGMAGWGTLQLIDVFTGGGGRASAAGTEADCGPETTPSPRATAPPPEPGGITVNVLNATTRSGLAKQTADELRKRGFKIGDVGNAPKKYDKKVKGTGVLLGPASSRNTTLAVLATQLHTAESRTDAARKGKAVDLIIGDRFRALTKKSAAHDALVALAHPKPAPSTSKKGC